MHVPLEEFKGPAGRGKKSPHGEIVGRTGGKAGFQENFQDLSLSQKGYGCDLLRCVRNLKKKKKEPKQGCRCILI